MGTLATLPVEIRLEILELLKPQEVNAPIVGVNGCWTQPTAVVKRSPPVDGCVAQDDPWITAMASKDVGKNVPSALWNLRQTNKEMNELCLPYLFSTINLIERDPEPSLPIPNKYGRHVRTLRILVDPFIQITYKVDERMEIARKMQEYHDAIIRLVRASRSLSIALYYLSAVAKIAAIAEEIATQTERGVIRSLGIYCTLVMYQDIGNLAWDVDPQIVTELLTPFISNPGFTKPLKDLEIAVTSLNQEAYDLIATHFTSLESLTIRRGLGAKVSRLRDPNQKEKWYPKSNLTRLHLIDCFAAYAPHIPELVHLYDSLRYLTVSTCGSWEDEPPPSRPCGWHIKPNALCAVRKPLDTLHIEHMTTWEITALGVIPAKRVMLSNMIRGDFLGAIRFDGELFPYLETLSVVPAVNGMPPDGGPSAHYREDQEDTAALRELSEFCKRRGANLNFKAYVIKEGVENYGFA